MAGLTLSSVIIKMASVITLFDCQLCSAHELEVYCIGVERDLGFASLFESDSIH